MTSSPPAGSTASRAMRRKTASRPYAAIQLSTWACMCGPVSCPQPERALNDPPRTRARTGRVHARSGTLARMVLAKKLLKVPEVTFYFWVIKIMCTTVGETAADYLNMNLGFGLTNTTYVTGALLLAALAVQVRLRRYVAPVYWLVVVIISVFGTLITDNLTERYQVPLTT